MDKYRIIKIENSQFHYAVQRRRFFFWWETVSVFINHNQAFRALKRLQRED